MGRTKKAAAAAKTAQDVREQPEVSQDIQEAETPPVTQEVAGPEDPAELLGCQEPAPEEEPILVTYAVAGCGYLRLRERPAPDGPIAAELPRGVGVLGEDGPAQGGWRWVATGRLEGWVLDEYLELLGPGLALADG